MLGVGMPELVIILVVAVILFGSKLPEVARNLGSSYQQFRKGLYDIQSSIKADLDLDSPPRKLSYRDYNDDYDAPPTTRFSAPPEAEEKN